MPSCSNCPSGITTRLMVLRCRTFATLTPDEKVLCLPRQPSGKRPSMDCLPWVGVMDGRGGKIGWRSKKAATKGYLQLAFVKI